MRSEHRMVTLLLSGHQGCVWLALSWVAVGHVAVFTRPSRASGPGWHFRPVGHE